VVVVVGFWVVVVDVVAVVHFQHCLDCCRVHLHPQSCQILFVGGVGMWHVKLALKVKCPILLVVLEVELQGGYKAINLLIPVLFI
jgi:hypothetical protein